MEKDEIQRPSSKKKKSKRKRDDDNYLLDTSGPSSSEHQDTTYSPQKLSIPSAAEILRIASQKSPTTQATSGPGSIFSLIATSSSSNSSQHKKSPYQIKTILGTVALLPSSLPDVSRHIHSLLHSLLLMYDASMGGVLLSLEEGVRLLPVDYKISDGERGNIGRSGGGGGGLVGGTIVDDLPYIHYRFQVKGLLFCPVVGMKLKGQVVECTPTFITLTTHHILSTKISTEKLHEQGFYYNHTTLEWTRSAGGETPSTSIYLDDIVEFVVERIHECGGYISLDGIQPSVSTLG